jgi:DNA polymerase
MKDLQKEFSSIVNLFRKCIERNIEEIKLKEYGFDSLHEEIKNCKKCSLWRDRINPVMGTGNLCATLVIIGEAPGHEEDLQGKPFVGQAGQLLEKMLRSIQIEKDQVYITNVIKCRPPANRNPKSEEIKCCLPYLKRQLDIIKPKLILTLGNFATQTLLESDKGIRELRGKVYQNMGIKIIPTFHPAALLRTPSLKRLAWDDLKLLAKEQEKLI